MDFHTQMTRECSWAGGSGLLYDAALAQPQRAFSTGGCLQRGVHRQDVIPPAVGWPLNDCVGCTCRKLQVPFIAGSDGSMGSFAQYYNLPWLGTRSLFWELLRVLDPAAHEHSE